MANPVGTYYRSTVSETCVKCKQDVVNFVVYDDGSVRCTNCAPSADVSE
jgi:hypothetical protein